MPVDTLQPSDYTAITVGYTENPVSKKKESLSAESFLISMDAACYEPGSSMDLRQFIDQEAHYEMRRSGYFWEKDRGFQPEDKAREVYDVTRFHVCQAVVGRGLEFFDSQNHDVSWQFRVPLKDRIANGKRENLPVPYKGSFLAVNPHLRGLPMKDLMSMVAMYRDLPDAEKVEGYSTRSFLSRVAGRMYTEQCLDSDWYTHTQFDGSDVLKRFLDKETHAAMLKKGMRWNRELNMFEPEENVAAVYGETRDAVARAFVLKGIDFVRRYGNYKEEPSGDDNNLRNDLTPYMEKLAARRAEKAAA